MCEQCHVTPVVLSCVGCGMPVCMTCNMGHAFSNCNQKKVKELNAEINLHMNKILKRFLEKQFLGKEKEK